MKVDLTLLYLFITGMGVINYGLCRWKLGRGLAKYFHNFRRSPQLNNFFQKNGYEYIVAQVWAIMGIVIVVFSAFRLLFLLDLLGVDTGCILGALSILYAKDMLLCATADFVFKRTHNEVPG